MPKACTARNSQSTLCRSGLICRAMSASDSCVRWRISKSLIVARIVFSAEGLTAGVKPQISCPRVSHTRCRHARGARRAPPAERAARAACAESGLGRTLERSAAMVRGRAQQGRGSSPTARQIRSTDIFTRAKRCGAICGSARAATASDLLKPRVRRCGAERAGRCGAADLDQVISTGRRTGGRRRRR